MLEKSLSIPSTKIVEHKIQNIEKKVYQEQNNLKSKVRSFSNTRIRQFFPRCITFSNQRFTFGTFIKKKS